MIRGEVLLIKDNKNETPQRLENKKYKNKPKSLKKKSKENEIAKANNKKEKENKVKKLSKDEVSFISYLVKSYGKIKKEDNTNNKKQSIKKKIIEMKKIRNHIKNDELKGIVKNKLEGKIKEKINSSKNESLKKLSIENSIETKSENISKKSTIFLKEINTSSRKIKQKKEKNLNTEDNQLLTIKNNKENKESEAILNHKKISIKKIETINIDHKTKEVRFEKIEIKGQKENIETKSRVQTENPVEQIGKLIQVKRPQGTRIFRLHLEPPELGKVYIQLTFTKDKKVDMKIYVEKGEVKEYFVHNISNLKNDLKAMGFDFEKPQIFTMAEFSAGDNRKGQTKDEEESRNNKFEKVKIDTPFEDKDLKEEYIIVMDGLSEKVNIMV